MATMSVSGVVSGMDWDSMIDELITKAAKPAQVQVTKRSNLTNKKSLFEEMKVMMNTLQSSMTSLKLPSTYKAKEVDIERIDTNGSYKGVLTATVNADAEVNVYDLKVNQLARAQTNRSKQITASTVSSALSDQGLTSGIMYINMAGQKVGIEIDSTDSLQTIKSKINNTVKTLDIPVEVTASVVDNRLIIRSDNTGLGSNTLSETLTYNLNNKNTITSFNVNDTDLGTDRFVIRANGNKLTYGTDYDVVNGNEIRWNQYEPTDEVKLGESVTATYKIADGDTYQTTGTYGTDEASITNLTVKDNGTLSSRVKITDDDGNTYTYGKDFTLDSAGKVVWLKATEVTTNEPSTYTVSYTKTTTESYSLTGEKTNPVKAPSSYTVSYDKTVSRTILSDNIPNYSGTYGFTLTGDGFPTFAEMTSTYGVTTTARGSGNDTINVLNLNNGGKDKVEILDTDGNSTSYVYDSAYYLKQAGSGENNNRTEVSIMWSRSVTKPDNGFTVKYTHSYTANSDDSSYESDVSTLISAAGTDTGKIKIKSTDGTTETEYTPGTHYDIENGKIVWKIQSEVTDITMDSFSDLQTKYAEAYKAEHGSTSTLSTVTLVDGNGVLRTYVDPEDRSLLTMKAKDSATGKTIEYEYGRDYVLRVNDSGTGYRFQWLVENSNSITDADTIVSTYAAHKNISTSEWRKAPSDGASYTFGFSYESTKTGSITVSSSAAPTTKNVTTFFDLSSLDNVTFKIADSSSTYKAGTDYAIDRTGQITWLEPGSVGSTELKATYQFSTTASTTTVSGISASSNYANLSGMPTLTNMGVTTFQYTGQNSVPYNYVKEAEGKAAFTLTDSTGREYVYGTDYALRSSNMNSGLQLVMPDNGNWATTGLSNQSKTRTIPAGETLTLTYNNSVTSNTKSYKTAEDAIGFEPSISNLGKLTLYDTDDNKYTEGTDYVIDVTTGNIAWIKEKASAPSSYTVNVVNNLATVTDAGTDSSSIQLNTGDDTSFPSYQNIVETVTKTGSTEQPIFSPNIIDVYSDDFNSEYSFSINGSSDFVYGRDYIIKQQGTDADSTSEDLLLVWHDDTDFVSDYATEHSDETAGTAQDRPASGYTAQFIRTRTAKSTDSSLSSVVSSFDTSKGDIITVTGSDGVTYKYNSSVTTINNLSSLADDEFAIVSGVIKFKAEAEDPQHPASGVGYTLTFDAYGAIDTEFTSDYDDDYTQAISIKVDSGYGNIGGNVLSYEQILSDAGSSSSNFAKNFTLTDEDGDEYVYGTDYRIIRGSDKDEDTGEHYALIEWLQAPATGENFTLRYLGRTDDTVDFTVERSYTDVIQTGTSGVAPLYSYFDGGTTTITQGAKTFYEGTDYEIVERAVNENGRTVTYADVEWKTGSNSEWYFPPSNASYTINLTTANGNSLSFNSARMSYDLIDPSFSSINGSITSVTFDGKSWDLTAGASTTTDDSGNTTTVSSGRDQVKNTLGLDVTINGGTNTLSFNWVTPSRTANADLPYTENAGIKTNNGAEFTAEYTYNANTFTLTDDSGGKLLEALELDLTDSDHYTAAQNAILELDGETIQRDSNDIGESYDNELIKGMTIHLKGIGEVSLDVAHDAEKAVESIQTFVDSYNDLMSWMNTRMTESEVDSDTAATIDSDDFRMRWGLLHGNSLLRQTKSKMRSITTQNFTFSFTQRTSAEEIYGNMSYNGLKAEATLRLRIANKFVDVSILPTDTLQDIIDKINDDTKGGAMNDIYYDETGKKLDQPLLKATIENDKLVISSTSDEAITMSGTSAMNALKMNYTYKGLYQLGIATTSEDYGKSGELEFDANEFMEALEDNADEVQELMLMFANEFDTWTKSMLMSSASGETSGTLTRQIEDLESQISTIDEYLEKYQDRLDRMEENLRTKYANTETSLAKLTQQASSIAAILNQLNGYTSSSSDS